MAKFDEAHELASAAQTDGESDDAALDTSYCTPVYVEIQRANCLIEMGEPLRAVEALEAELRILPQVYRTDHGVYLSRLARAYATAGEPEQGAEAATHALSIAMDTESARAMAELSAAAKVLATWSAVPAVMAFSTRFNLARGTVAYGVRGGR
jgi:predicted Zn-dependent protease